MLGKSTDLLLKLAIEQEAKNAVEQHGKFWNNGMYRDALEEELEEVEEAYKDLKEMVETGHIFLENDRIQIARKAIALQGEITQVLAVLKKYDDFLEQYKKFEK